MELLDILILVSAGVIIVFLWLITGYKHFKYLQGMIAYRLEQVDELLRKRQNLVPNLIETVRKYTDKQEILMEDLIENRMKAAKQYEAGAKKIEFEIDLTRSINKVVDLGKIHKELSQDTNFLEIRKDINSLETEIENRLKEYNQEVRKYNKNRRKFYLMPISGLFGFKVANIFEFEK